MGERGRERVHKTIMTVPHPKWERFRGATYDGRATHDPIAQNMVANMLRRGRASHFPPAVLLQIAFYASNDSGLHSKKMPLYHATCRPDIDGKRMLKAFQLSRMLRRMLTSIPHNFPIATRYHKWTYYIARAENLVQPGCIATVCNHDPQSIQQTTTNRLLIRGLSKHLLDGSSITKESRPAYFPTFTEFDKWCNEALYENTEDRILTHAQQINEQHKKLERMMDQYILKNRHEDEFALSRMGCTKLVRENLHAIEMLQQRIQKSRFESRIRKWGASIYTAINILQLNKAERDWFYMISPNQHDFHDNFP